jgi:transposase
MPYLEAATPRWLELPSTGTTGSATGRGGHRTLEALQVASDKKKRCRELGAHLAFLDESGFLLIPTFRRTWGPQGQAPVVRYNYRHDRISALATLTVSARRKHMGLYVRFQQDSFTAEHIVRFLKVLLRHLRGNVILLWDGGKIHKGPIITAFLENHPRLQVERFPGYAPELNPVEQIWKDYKGHSANTLFLNKQDIRLSLHGNTRRVRRSQAKLRSFILSSELPSPPWCRLHYLRKEQ